MKAFIQLSLVLQVSIFMKWNGGCEKNQVVYLMMWSDGVHVQSSEESHPCCTFCLTYIRAYRANQWEQKASAHTGSDVSDWQDEPCGHTLLVCLVRERQVSLCHANWQIAKTLRREDIKKYIGSFTKAYL